MSLTFLIIGSALPVIIGAIACYNSVPSFDPYDITPLPVKPKPTIGQTAELVGALLQGDSGWTIQKSGSTYRAYWTHETGVSIREVRAAADPRVVGRIRVEIADENLEYKEAELTNDDVNYLKSELKSFEARRKDYQQRELRRALAERVVKRGQGTLHPVPTGSLGPATDAEDDSVAGNDSVPAGLLTYDKSLKQVVATGGSNSKRLMLSTELADRYNMSARLDIMEKLNEKLVEGY